MRPSYAQVRQTGQQFTAPKFRNYQGIVLAEFVAAVLLVAATPIATRKNQPGLSPYVPRDLTKLLALGLVYFILQLLSVGGESVARWSAWAGGLILLVVGLNEAADLAKVFGVLSGGQGAAKSAAATAGQSVTSLLDQIASGGGIFKLPGAKSASPSPGAGGGGGPTPKAA